MPPPSLEHAQINAGFGMDAGACVCSVGDKEQAAGGGHLALGGGEEGDREGTRAPHGRGSCWGHRGAVLGGAGGHHWGHSGLVLGEGPGLWALVLGSSTGWYWERGGGC